MFSSSNPKILTQGTTPEKVKAMRTFTVTLALLSLLLRPTLNLTVVPTRRSFLLSSSASLLLSPPTNSSPSLSADPLLAFFNDVQAYTVAKQNTPVMVVSDSAEIESIYFPSFRMASSLLQSIKKSGACRLILKNNKQKQSGTAITPLTPLFPHHQHAAESSKPKADRIYGDAGLSSKPLSTVYLLSLRGKVSGQRYLVQNSDSNIESAKTLSKLESLKRYSVPLFYVEKMEIEGMEYLFFEYEEAVKQSKVSAHACTLLWLFILTRRTKCSSTRNWVTRSRTSR